MGKSLKIKFHKETEKQKKKRERRYRRYILKRTFIIIIIIALISFLAYFIFNLNFFNVKIKNALNQTENVQPAVIVPQDSVVVENKIVSESPELNDSASSPAAADDGFLRKKYVLNDSISGYFGISISEWQQTVNWDSLLTNNETRKIKFVIIKSTQGASSLDKQFYNNLKNARNPDINIGACHFYVLTDDPLQQAENYIKIVQLVKGDLYPIVKIEVNPAGSLALETDKVEILKQFTIFLNRLEEQYGVKPILFTSYQFYNKFFRNKLIDYKYMFANYNDKPHPWILPAGNTETQLAQFAFIWQFSFNEKLSGIATNVRMNFIPKDKLDLIVFE